MRNAIFWSVLFIGAGTLLVACSAQQLANAQTAVQIGKTIWCEYEPATGAIVGVLDTSNGTLTTLDKLAAATAIICDQARPS